MDVIKIDKLKYYAQEQIEGTIKWYCCKESKDSCFDLYDAEQIIKSEKNFEGVNYHLIHFPEGTVHSPFELRENLYIEKPVWDNKNLFFLSVDFNKNVI